MLTLQKPPVMLPQIDWQSSILDNVAFLCMMNETTGGITELLSGRALLPGSTSAKTTSRFGPAALFDGASTSICTVAGFKPMQKSDGTLAGNMTMLMLANITPGASHITVPMAQTDATDDNGFQFFSDISSTFGFSAGGFAIVSSSGGSANKVVVAGLVDSTYHVYCGREFQGTLDLFFDGVKQAGSTASSNNTANGTPQLKFGGSADGTCVGQIAFGIGWNRGLTDSEIFSFSKTLWNSFLLDDSDGLIPAAGVAKVPFQPQYGMAPLLAN